MSPFLFILAMEGLHALTIKTETLGLFKGAFIGRDNMSISHLMYADDVIFFSEWSWINAHNLISMLRCFHLISGLQINIHKSNVLSVGVTEYEVSYMANNIACGAFKFPLKYLGVPFGCNMASGCLSLIKSVLDEKKMTWIKWNRCLASKEGGGLGIGSIYGFNIGLLFRGLKCSTWGSILSSIDSLKSKGLLDWNMVLRRTPSGGAELVQFNSLKDTIGKISLTVQRDSWQWSLDTSVSFSVDSGRYLADSCILDTGPEATR
nr:RNA-directed DNA polymerase, eukaryota, reverse transcriptase zinc-binding domain protein [Tanacetum cinerariifolium]